MKQLNNILLLTLYFLLCHSLKAQEDNYVQIGAWLGAANYQGDLVSGYLVLQETKPAFGIYGQIPVIGPIDIRASLSSAWVGGNDKYSDDPLKLKRNLSFRSNIIEASGQLVLRLKKADAAWVPYLYGGAAIIRFNPKAKYEGQWHALRPLGTEGQGLTNENPLYNLSDIAIPFGGGIQLKWRDNWYIGIELGYRKTFTDYLDDVSTVYHSHQDLLEKRGELAAALADRSIEYTNDAEELFLAGNERGNAEYGDNYLQGGITLSRLLQPITQRGKRGSGCPTF